MLYRGWRVIRDQLQPIRDGASIKWAEAHGKAGVFVGTASPRDDIPQPFGDAGEVDHPPIRRNRHPARIKYDVPFSIYRNIDFRPRSQFR